jgi:hypothetical protein
VVKETSFATADSVESPPPHPERVKRRKKRTVKQLDVMAPLNMVFLLEHEMIDYVNQAY